jgi:hypothetical protein
VPPVSVHAKCALEVTQHRYQESGREVLRRMGGTGWHWPWQDPTVREIMAETGTADKPWRS